MTLKANRPTSTPKPEPEFMETTINASNAVPTLRADTSKPLQDERLFEIWKEYEEVAKHFNDLLIRLRTQALGGAAAISAFATIITNGDLVPSVRWELLVGIFLLLVFFWVAVWILDVLYYNRLLYGAVAAIMEIEQASQNGEPLSGLWLSTQIEEAVANKKHLKARPNSSNEGATALRGRVPVHTFYAVVLLALLLGLAFSIVGFAGLRLAK